MIEKTHGLSGLRAYTSYKNMKRQCARYGLPIYEPWRDDFRAFVRYIGDRPFDHRLELIDKRHGMVPGNVRYTPKDYQEYYHVDARTIAENVRRTPIPYVSLMPPRIPEPPPTIPQETIQRIESMKLDHRAISEFVGRYTGPFLSLYSKKRPL